MVSNQDNFGLHLEMETNYKSMHILVLTGILALKIRGRSFVGVMCDDRIKYKN